MVNDEMIPMGSMRHHPPRYRLAAMRLGPCLTVGERADGFLLRVFLRIALAVGERADVGLFSVEVGLELALGKGADVIVLREGFGVGLSLSERPVVYLWPSSVRCRLGVCSGHVSLSCSGVGGGFSHRPPAAG
jgi:hypothetical protein